MKTGKTDWKAMREMAALAREYGELADTHRESSEYWTKLSRLVQAGVIILSGVGTFISSLPIDSTAKSVAGSCCSATTGILSSIYVAFGLGKRGIKHDDVATGFKSLEKSLRLEMLKPSWDSDDVLELIDFCETTREKLLKQIK